MLDRAILNLTAAEMTVLVGGFRACASATEEQYGQPLANYQMNGLKKFLIWMLWKN